MPFQVVNAGPSPRARGARGFDALPGRERGTIPACAGSTPRRRGNSPATRDHPRVRGEHITLEARLRAKMGPSPRARGAQPDRVPRALPSGTIPACAGSTPAVTSGNPSLWDHPRVRGEHAAELPAEETVTGPSPRARGAPGRNFGGMPIAGTIPACAGSTSSGPPRWCPWRDHPRVRGEHRSSSRNSSLVTGPSPRARGARCGRRARVHVAGTIPACAGSTLGQGVDGQVPRDHPRVRGEHWGPSSGGVYRKGPSPRARGARPGSYRRPRCRGTIPACAGSTGPVLGGVHQGGDHPRVRGEHTSSTLRPVPWEGPSPRARGAQQGPRRPNRPTGTIPACAGSTLRW